MFTTCYSAASAFRWIIRTDSAHTPQTHTHTNAPHFLGFFVNESHQMTGQMNRSYGPAKFSGTHAARDSSVYSRRQFGAFCSEKNRQTRKSLGTDTHTYTHAAYTPTAQSFPLYTHTGSTYRQHFTSFVHSYGNYFICSSSSTTFPAFIQIKRVIKTFVTRSVAVEKFPKHFRRKRSLDSIQT